MDGGPRILVKISDRSLLLGKRAIEGRAERPYNLRRMGVEEAVAGGGSLGNFFFPLRPSGASTGEVGCWCAGGGGLGPCSGRRLAPAGHW